MKYFWATFGWIWSRKKFFGATLLSAILFFVWFFPFSDLSGMVTSAVAGATGGQVYVQFGSLDLHLLPQPAISATDLSVETALPPLEAKWAKFTPSLIGAIFSLPTLVKAMSGDQVAASQLGTKLGATIDAEGLLGADAELSLGPGRKSDQGVERSHLRVNVSDLSLAEVQKWSDLSLAMSGQANFQTDMQVAMDWQEQPDGDYLLEVKRFVLPAGTVMVPMGEANLPVNLPTITLANVKLKGRLSAGNLIIEEGSFGQNRDPIYGRIKGQMGVRFQALGRNVVPLFGSYNLTVELTTNALIEKDLGFAFLPLSSAKTPTAGGGGHYLFRAMGRGIGMAYAPNITRVNTF